MLRRKSSRILGSALVLCCGIAAVAGATPANAQSAGDQFGPSTAAQEASCPTGLQAVVPSQAAVREHGIRAMIPANATEASIEAMMNSPILQKAAAENVTWVGSLGCGASDVKAGLAEPPREGSGSAVPAPASVSYRNWAGYAFDDIDFDHAYYNQAAQTWIVPGAESGVTTTQRHISIWPGIGTGHSADDVLIQAGTDTVSGPTGVQLTYGFLEAFPTQPTELPITSLPINAGDSVGSVVTVNARNSAFFSLCDYTSATCASASLTLSYDPGALNYGLITGQNVEWILERSGLPVGFSELGKFGTEVISNAGGAQVYGDGTHSDSFKVSTPVIAPAARDKITMSSCDGKTALTSAPSTPTLGGSFSLTWKHYESIESC